MKRVPAKLHGMMPIAFAALLGAPIGIVATILLLPLWKWLEFATGVEAVGHSGPAEWCYAATCLVVFGVLALLFLLAGSFARNESDTG